MCSNVFSLFYIEFKYKNYVFPTSATNKCTSTYNASYLLKTLSLTTKYTIVDLLVQGSECIIDWTIELKYWIEVPTYTHII